jgi:deoxyribodipyrimidine photo-lyase
MSFETERLTLLNSKEPDPDKDYVLYWMQASQRAEHNPALNYAIERANLHKKPLITAFCLVDNFPDASQAHYKFMLEGLSETESELNAKGIKFIFVCGRPDDKIAALCADAVEVVTDRGCLRIERQWRSKLKTLCPCRMSEVDSNVVVPIDIVSGKQEYSAATIRKKITSRLNQFLKLHEQPLPENGSLSLNISGIRNESLAKHLKNIETQTNSRYSFRGGNSNAKKHLQSFVKNNLKIYEQKSNDPAVDIQSNLSPYLHFGQISPVYIALEVKKSGQDKESIDSFLEQLIVRRELAFNFVWFNKNYDKYSGLPAWARASLEKHQTDKRQYEYSYKQLKNAQTHDPYWNAAQTEMLKTGKMHGYMRMYWGKKIIEWTLSPKTAYRTALKLNNTYELDGRDPNGFTGIAWCFGLHDRPWTERCIFGKIRYMNAAGLERKFNIRKYVERVSSL